MSSCPCGFEGACRHPERGGTDSAHRGPRIEVDPRTPDLDLSRHAERLPRYDGDPESGWTSGGVLRTERSRQDQSLKASPSGPGPRRALPEVRGAPEGGGPGLLPQRWKPRRPGGGHGADPAQENGRERRSSRSTAPRKPAGAQRGQLGLADPADGQPVPRRPSARRVPTASSTASIRPMPTGFRLRAGLRERTPAEEPERDPLAGALEETGRPASPSPPRAASCRRLGVPARRASAPSPAQLGLVGGVESWLGRRRPGRGERCRTLAVGRSDAESGRACARTAAISR